MNASDIVQLREELKARDASRHAKYEYLMEAMGGDYETRRLDGLWRKFQEFVGIDQKIALDRELFEFRLNLIPSIIESSRSFIATIPSLRCPASDPVDPEARKQAEKLERVYAGFWQYSYIGKRMNQLGYWNPSLGNTIGVVWPDIDNKRPMLQMRSPYGFYPVIRDLDGFDLSAAIFTTKYTRRQVKAMYPKLKLVEGNQLCEVTQYIDEREIVTIVDDIHVVKTIENKWKFVPIVIIPNRTFGEGPWGDNDIEWVVPLQAENNYRNTIQNVVLSLLQMQPIAVEDGDNVPEEMAFGPLDTINVNPGGRVYRVAPPQIPYQHFQANNDLIKMIDRVGQVPSVMRGEMSGGTATGKGISALTGPIQMAYNVKGNEIYPALAVLNKMAMRMWLAMWGKEEHTVFSISDKGNKSAMQVEKFRPADFDPWFENVVYVDQSSYFDAQSRFMINLQAVQNRLMSRQLASSLTPGVDDAIADQEQVKKELEEDMQMAQGNEARDEANVQPNVASQGATNANLSKGFMAKTPVPETIGGFEAPPAEGEAPPEETAPETSGLLELFIEFFQEVPLKGKVWLAGNIVTDPSYSPQAPSWNGVEVFLEAMNDKSAINQKMRDEFEKVWGSLKYKQGPPSGDEPSILVFDPSAEGEEELPDMAEGMPGPEMPPEMAAAGAMGGERGAEMGGMPPEMAGLE